MGPEKMSLVFVIFASIGFFHEANSATIAAFNIQTFGVAKMDNPFAVEQIRKILLQYDLVLIQEIRDVSETAIYELLDILNANSPGNPYNIELSERLGTTPSYKEQYAYIYRPSQFSVIGSYQFPFGKFERPPFSVRFRPTSSAPEFGFIGIHVKPDDAVSEIDALHDVYTDLRSRWGIENFILGGDFNAGCNYVSPGDWSSIRLRTDSRFVWFIGDDADTNVADTKCPYDRLVGIGSALVNSIRNPDVFYFDQAYGLTQAQAFEVSDHYPVQCVMS